MRSRCAVWLAFLVTWKICYGGVQEGTTSDQVTTGQGFKRAGSPLDANICTNSGQLRIVSKDWLTAFDCAPKSCGAAHFDCP